MARRIEAPVTRNDPRDSSSGETVTTHPAFAQISVSRSSGGHSYLYGSDFDHHARLTISIAASQLRRNLSNDWFFEQGQYIEVELSEAQWATFVSTPNVGSGVPCTLTWLRGEGVVPGLPAPESRASQFGAEAKAAIDAAMADLEAAANSVDGLGLSKVKADALKAKIMAGADRLRGHIPFIADQFDEHIEGTVEKAKAEVHGYMTGQIMRAGLASLTGEASLPLRLADDAPAALANPHPKGDGV